MAILYRESVDPITTDGRDIDSQTGILSGEGSQQLAELPSGQVAAVARAWHGIPGNDSGDPTYYDRPMLKEPVWKVYIPIYYFAGGAAGASLALGAAAQLDGSRDLDGFVRRCHWVGIIGSSIGGVMLIADLGRPSRFLNMLRVFRPTSPMNVGAWIIATAPAAAVTAGLFARRSEGLLRTIGEMAGYASGVLGAALATYTGVLLGNSAVPVWSESRRVLPILFGASAMASAGALFDLFELEDRARRIMFVFGLAGRLGELTAGAAMEHAVRRVPRVARPLQQGLSGFLWRTATALTIASTAMMILPGRKRGVRMVSGALGLSGSLLLRFAVEQAGKASARDPRASFHLQRFTGGMGSAGTTH